MGRPARRVSLSPEERASLESVVRRPSSPQRDVLRARIALLAGDGVATGEIARQLGLSLPVVCKWRQRVASHGLQGLRDVKRSGRPPRLTPAQRLELVALACEPLNEGEGRVTPTLDEVIVRAVQRGVVEGISRSHLHRILQGCDLRPHRVKMWLHSVDPDFRQKATEICDLYLHPPAGSVVLSIDEKTGMQALERKAVGRSPAPGRPRRREFEYIRHGTQSLIASFEVATGKIFGHCGPTRTGDDLEAFMDDLASAYPDGDVHVIWDNLNIHRAKHSRWDAFNKRHGGRFHFHFTPLHASWVNQIELWFGLLARRCLRNASFRSAEGLRRAVLRFIDEWNVDAHPFRWTFTGYPLQMGE